MRKDWIKIMIRLAPSILSSDFSRLGEEVEEIEKAGAHVTWTPVFLKGGNGF